MSPRCSILLALLAAGCPLNKQSLPAFGERCQNSGDCNREFACFIAQQTA